MPLSSQRVVTMYVVILFSRKVQFSVLFPRVYADRSIIISFKKVKQQGGARQTESQASQRTETEEPNVDEILICFD